MVTAPEIKALHDRAVKDWLLGGELIHVWRQVHINGDITSYYVAAFKHDRVVGIDCIRVFGYGAVSVDQRADIFKDKETYFRHPRKEMT